MRRENYYVVYWKDHEEFRTPPATFEKALEDKNNLRAAGYYGYIKRLAEEG